LEGSSFRKNFIPHPSPIREMMAKAPPDALNLGIGEPVFPTPAPVLEYVKENIHRWNLGYTPNAGLTELREKIARSQARFTKAAQVCITNGAQEALYAACHTSLSPGDEALVPNPGFLAYPNLVKMVGATPVDYPMPRTPKQSFDISALEKKITARTKVLIINSPSNPTGFCFLETDLANIAQICGQRGITVITDEVYRELYYDSPRPPGIYEAYENCILISSLSKTASMTGWRLGWAIGPEAVMPSFTRVHQYLTTCASALSQFAAVYILEGHADGALREMRLALQKRRDLFLENLGENSGWKVEKPAAGLFLFAGLPEYLSRLENPAEYLLEKHHIVSVPGNAFGSRGQGFIRFSFAAEEKTITEACRRLRRTSFGI
jgi:aspartate/methionine/tyrosine aminotransferase